MSPYVHASLVGLAAVLLLSPASFETMAGSVLALSNWNAELGVRLFQAVAKRSDDNVLLSPFALTSGLQALVGATEGNTREDLLEGLGLGGVNVSALPDQFQTLRTVVLKEDQMLDLQQAGAVFPDQSITVSQSYQDQVAKFGAEVRPVSYGTPHQAVDTINRWALEGTQDQVQELLSTLQPETQLLLASASACKVLVSPSSDSIAFERFVIDSYNVAVVPMMHRSDRYYLAYDASLKVGVVRVPLVGEPSAAMAMLAVLPDEDVDISDVEAALTAEKIRDWVRRLRKTRLELQLPLFLIQRSYSLKEVLESLGVSQVFQEDANLSGMGGAKGLKLTEVYQKSVVSVSEGTNEEAGGPPPTFSTPPPRLTFNRPFLFIVYHQSTTSLLLIGRVTDPSPPRSSLEATGL